MTTTLEELWRERADAPRWAAACLAAVAATLALVALGSEAYESVLGMARPVAPVVAVVGLGFGGWLVLARRSWIPASTEGPAGYRAAVLIGLALPLPVIGVDCLGGFGPGINAPAPDALLFYPSIAVVAESVFHIAPLAAAATLAFFVRRAGRSLELCGLVAAVAIEPILQVVWGAEASPGWANAYVGVHLLAFNLIAVVLLRRFGILRALVFRLSYYFVWHILWGFLRLELLFSG
ncbi:MAG: hypothetical protein SX243_09540 [Acidobacteriota bacterium]|nr:hypothetical protein [Acidobacteriota bacterium]